MERIRQSKSMPYRSGLFEYRFDSGFLYGRERVGVRKTKKQKTINSITANTITDRTTEQRNYNIITNVHLSCLRCLQEEVQKGYFRKGTDKKCWRRHDTDSISITISIVANTEGNNSLQVFYRKTSTYLTNILVLITENLVQLKYNVVLT